MTATPPTVRRFARRRCPVTSAARFARPTQGAAVNYAGMHDGKQGAQYPATALSQFNLWTAENECKVGPVHPQPTEYAFTQCDYLAAAAVANSSVFRMHNYCWDNEVRKQRREKRRGEGRRGGGSGA